MYLYPLALALIWPVLTVNSGCPPRRLRNGRAKYSRRDGKLTYRCRPGYQLYGAASSLCVRNRWNEPLPACVAPGCPPIPADGTRNATSLLNGGVMTFSCPVEYYLAKEENILCNGTHWSAPPPVCEGYRFLKGCDFEDKALCGWQQSTTDDFDWTWHKGSTLSIDTGPNSDHTLKTMDGHYLYIETSSNEEKDQAKLLSPKYDSNQSDHCFKFWYHMYGKSGDGVGALVVSVDLSDETLVLFNRSGNIGNKWLEAEVYIKKLDAPFQIVMSASKGSHTLGDIAIDDVSLGNCSDGFTRPSEPVSSSASVIEEYTSPITTEDKALTTEPPSFSITDDSTQTPYSRGSVKLTTEAWLTTDTPIEKSKKDKPKSDGLSSNSDTTDVSSLTICLGVGIPVMIVVVALAILFYIRRRRSASLKLDTRRPSEMEAIYPQSPVFDKDCSTFQ